MSESNALYRVQFICHNERYEVYVREVSQGQLFGFIEIANFVWDNHTALIVDPSHEKLKSEFADVNRTMIPMHHVLRVDQVRKQGPPASPNWATTSLLPQPHLHQETLTPAMPGRRVPGRVVLISARGPVAGCAGGTSAGPALLRPGRTTPGCG